MNVELINKDTIMIGAKIKERRTQMGMSLRQLARDTEFTASYISQLERGLVEPSLISLRKISAVLEVPLYYLLMDDTKNHILIKSDERKKLTNTDNTMSVEFLSPMVSDPDFNVKIVTALFRVQPHSRVSQKPLMHDGDETMYILKGTLKVVLDSTEYILEAGDCLYINSNVNHEMYNETEEEIIGISSISSS